MRKLCLVTVVLVWVACVAGQAFAAPPPAWTPQATVPVTLTVDGYAKVNVVNSALDLSINLEGPFPQNPWEAWPGQSFVHLDVQTNMGVRLDVYGADNGRLRSAEGLWFKNDYAKGNYLSYQVCGGWADTPEEFMAYWQSPPHPELTPGAYWVPPGSGQPQPQWNHLVCWPTGEIGYPLPAGPDSWPVTLSGWAGFDPNAGGAVAPTRGVYKGELIVYLTPQTP